MFNIFNKKGNYELPRRYSGILTSEEYNIVVQMCRHYYSKKEFEIKKIKDGEIVAEINGGEQSLHLDNLVRFLSENDRTKWQELINEQLDKMNPNLAALNYLFTDFEYAVQFLRVLIKEDAFNLGDEIENYVHRVDFPETITFLILEFEEKLHYVRRNEIREWKKSDSELFDIAISNIQTDEIELRQAEFAEKFTVFLFFSGDYAASLMLDLKNRCEYAIGRFGTLIAIPAKGVAYAHPIEEGNLLELIEIINPGIQQFYNENTGSITTNYYWYYNNEIQVFARGRDEKGVFVKLPADLITLQKSE